MLWRLLFVKGLPLYARVLFLAWVSLYTWAATWALGFTYLILAIMVGAPIFALGGMDFFGTPLSESMDAIRDMSVTQFLCMVDVVGSFNWYFRVFILFGMFFPFAYYFLGWGLKPIKRECLVNTSDTISSLEP